MNSLYKIVINLQKKIDNNNYKKNEFWLRAKTTLYWILLYSINSVRSFLNMMIGNLYRRRVYVTEIKLIYLA